MKPSDFDDWNFGEHASGLHGAFSDGCKVGAAMIADEIHKELNVISLSYHDGNISFLMTAEDWVEVYRPDFGQEFIDSMLEDPNTNWIGAVENLLEKMKKARASNGGADVSKAN